VGIIPIEQFMFYYIDNTEHLRAHKLNVVFRFLSIHGMNPFGAFNTAKAMSPEELEQIFKSVMRYATLNYWKVPYFNRMLLFYF
jgi:hypothetical protein